MKYVQKIFYTVLQLALFILLPFAVFTLLTTKLPVFGIQSFVVLTGSMQPTLPVGSVVYTKKQREYIEGDIITFKNESNQIVTHRITRITTDNGITRYITKGDANNATDATSVSVGNVLGKEKFFAPYIGHFIDILHNPLGFIGLIILPTLLFIGFEIVNIKKEIDTHIKKKIAEAVQKA